MKIFISGPTSGMNKIHDESFRNAQNEIQALNIGKAIIPQDLFEGVDLGPENSKDAFRLEIIELLECSAVVMIGEWMSNEHCIIVKRIAQYAGIPVKSYERFVKSYTDLQV